MYVIKFMHKKVFLSKCFFVFKSSVIKESFLQFIEIFTNKILNKRFAGYDKNFSGIRRIPKFTNTEISFYPSIINVDRVGYNLIKGG